MRTSKSLRRLLIPSLAAAAFACCWIAAPASGDTLCSVNEAPCSSEHAVKVGTLLETEGSAELNPFEIHCNSSASYELKQNPVKGGEGVPIVVEPKAETFSGCTSKVLGRTCSVQATKLRSAVEWAAMSESEAMEIFGSNSPGDGRVTSPPFSNAVNLEFTCGETSCKFEGNSGGGIHAFEGGNPASEVWVAFFKFKSGAFGCSLAPAVTGERRFSSPAGGLYWTLG